MKSNVVIKSKSTSQNEDESEDEFEFENQQVEKQFRQFLRILKFKHKKNFMINQLEKQIDE